MPMQKIQGYVPIILRTAGILLVAVFIGHADAIRLLAVMSMVKAGAVFPGLQTTRALVRRRAASPEVRRASFKVALQIEFFSLILSLLVIVGLFVLLDLLQAPTAKTALAIMACGVPAPRLLIFSKAGRPRVRFRLVASATFLGAILLCNVSGGDSLLDYSVWIAASRWLAVLSLLPGTGMARTGRAVTTTALSWSEVLESAVRGKIAHIPASVRNILLKSVLGPVGKIVNRAISDKKIPGIPAGNVVVRWGDALFVIPLLSAITLHRVHHDPSSLLLLAGSCRLFFNSLALRLLLLSRPIWPRMHSGSAEVP